MNITIRDDNGNIIKEAHVDVLVGIGITEVPEQSQELLSTFLINAGNQHIAFVSKLLDTMITQTMIQQLNVEPNQIIGE